MTCFLASLAMFAAGLLLGYWIKGHPDDTRAFLTRAKDSIGKLFHKEDKS
jgi:hypothetical protein